MSTVIDTPSPELRERLLVLIEDDPDADIILRSCDHHKFRVPKLYIVKSSPVLRELINTLSNPHAANMAASLPSIQLSDSGVILSHLLTFVLPMVPVLPSTTEQTMLLLSVAQKYQMNSTLCHLRVIVASQHPPFIRPETAFQVYSLAQTHGLRQEALQAARTTLTFRFTVEDLEDELSTIPGTHLHELWKYYQRVRTHLISDLMTLKATGATMLTTPCSQIISYGTLNWLDAYIESIAVSPELFDLTEFHMCLMRHAKIGYSQCQCGVIPAKTIHAFWMALTNVVHSCMTKAESEGGPPTDVSPALATNSPPPDLRVPDADVVIQSHDLVTYPVRKSTLAMSSPFFDDMFRLPQPSDSEMLDGLPVVRLSEDAEVLNSLLTMLYPIPPVLPDSYDKFLALLAASKKYDMVGVQSHIRAEIQSRTFPTPTAAAAFRAYAISSRGGLPSEMESSARLTLNFPMTFECICDELPLFEGWALRDLIGFRKRCRDNLLSCFQSFLNYDHPSLNIWISCTDTTNAYSRSLYTGKPSWLHQLFQPHLIELCQGFANALFNPPTIRGKYLSALQAHLNGYNCLSCTRVHTLNGEAFCEELESRLKLALSKESVISG